MTFAWPHLLWLLVAPVALLGWECTRRRGAVAAVLPKVVRAEAGVRSVSLVAAPPSAPKRPARAWLCAGLVLAIAALARPQWGRLDQPVFQQAREIVIALDLSRSMETPDVKPSRLDRAKLLIESLLDHLKGERVGLVIFSGTAFVQVPLSSDYEILRDFLPALNPSYMPEGGTNYGALLDTAAAAFTSSGGADRFLIILSDGGATDDDWRSRLSELKAKGIRVIALGVGTAGGGFMPDGAGGFIKDDRGAVVLSRLDGSTLRELAKKTGGAYRDASSWVDLPALLQSTIEAGRRGHFVDQNDVRYVERFQWALAPALLCFLLSFWREFPVRPKPRDVRLTGGAAGVEPAVSTAAPDRTVATIAGIALLALTGLTASLKAQTDESQGPVDAAPLTDIVGRLANQPRRSALDWSEFAGETVSWGQRAQAAQQPVPAGPIHDGLAAVDAGSALDARAADWPKLRADLEALLPKPQRRPPPQRQNQQQQQQQQSQQNQQNQQGQSNPQNSSGSPQPQSQTAPPEQNSPGQPQGQPPNQGALGAMNPPQDAGTQQVGGAPQSRQREPATANPEVEASIEKLDQIRDRDSPAELYQMLQNNEPHPPAAKPAKDW